MDFRDTEYFGLGSFYLVFGDIVWFIWGLGFWVYGLVEGIYGFDKVSWSSLGLFWG